MRKTFSEFLIWGKILDSEDLEIKYTQATHLQMSPQTGNFFPCYSVIIIINVPLLVFWLLLSNFLGLHLNSFMFKKVIIKIGYKQYFHIKLKFNTHHTASIKTHLFLKGPERSTYIVLSPSSSRDEHRGGAAGAWPLVSGRRCRFSGR